MTAVDQLKAAGLKQVEAALQIAQLTLAGAENLFKLQVDAAKSALEAQATQIKALSEVQNPQQALALRAQLAEVNLDSALDYSRSIYETASRTQAELSKLLEAQVTEYNKDVISTLEKTAKSAPAGSEPAVAAIKQTVQATAAAVDSLTKAAKQVADFAEASVKAATTATVDAVKTANKAGAQ